HNFLRNISTVLWNADRFQKHRFYPQLAEMSDIRVLLIGNGGREHALAWKLSQSARVEAIFVVPGNGGTATCPKVTNVNS
ncbi:hypothetical protein E4U31_000603, partial [Claviceps sp. LM219 group G6]